jgi:hypothetical protein
MDRKIYLLTIERPATARNAEKTMYSVSAVVCGPHLAGDEARRNPEDASGRPPGASDPARRGEDPARTGGGADSSAWRTKHDKSGGGQLVHLHVSSAN